MRSERRLRPALDSIEEDAKQLDLGFRTQRPSFDADLNGDSVTKEHEIGRNVDVVARVESDALHMTILVVTLGVG